MSSPESDGEDDGRRWNLDRVLHQMRAAVQDERRRFGVDVHLGPHDAKPVQLLALVTDEFTTLGADPALVRDRTREWLLELLAAAGVDLGAEDRDVLDYCVEQLDATELQVVAGWVARGRLSRAGDRTDAELADAIEAAVCRTEAQAARAPIPRKPMPNRGPQAARRGPVGERVRELRRGARLTQAQLADRLAYSVSMVRQVEQGRHPGSPEFITAVARLFSLRRSDIAPNTAASVVTAPEPRPDDAVTLITEVLAVLPDTIERLDREHVEGPDRLCVACSARWPCVTGWAVARARWLARNDTGEHRHPR